MSGIEAIGDAVTGAAVATAIESRRGSADIGHTHEGACLNCGTRLTGEYCHACGQRAHVHRTLGAFGHDLLHGVLHFEGKIWRTLPMLAWRPGELTRRYVAGERARFVSPLALFLFSVFLTFAVIGWIGGPFGSVDDAVRADGGLTVAEGIAREDRKIAAIETRRAAAIAAGEPLGAIDAQLKSAREEGAMLRLIAQRGVAEALLTSGSDGLDDDAPAWINDAYKKAKANPSLLLYKLQTSTYKYSWALIPISLPFLWLLFPSRRRRMYDHAVFVTYSLSFMTLLMVVASTIKAVGIPKSVIESMLFVAPPVHMYRQLRGAYGLRRRSALPRTVLLLIFSIVAAMLFVAMLLALGLLG